MARSGDGAASLRVHRLGRDQQEEGIGMSGPIGNEAFGALLEHVSRIVLGTMAETVDRTVLVDGIVVIARAPLREGVPEIPAGRHPIARIADRRALELDIGETARPGEQRAEAALLPVA